MKLCPTRLVLVLACLLSACSSPKPPPLTEAVNTSMERVLHAIETSVEDAGRRERALQAARDIRDNDVRFMETVASFQSELQKLNRDYDSTRTSFDSWKAGFIDARKRYRTDHGTRLDALKDALESGEWAQVWSAYQEELTEIEGAYL